MYLIVGLGNPGDEYVSTRHNVGRMIVEALREKYMFSDWNKSNNAQALYTRGVIEGIEAELMLPETFMNKSGVSVKYAVDKHEVEPKKVMVVYDDVDLPLGEIKISISRGDGGHNGTASITQAIKTKEFIRIRVGVRHVGFFGVAKRPTGEKLSKYVLGKFKGGELKKLQDVTEEVEKAVSLILTEGVEKAMQECN